MQMENALGSPLTEDEMKIQSCVEPGDHGHQQPKNYTDFLYFITGYMCFSIVIFIGFFKTEMKRTKADELRRASSRNNAMMTKSISKDSEAPILDKSSDTSGSISGSSSGISGSGASGIETNSFEGIQRGP